MTNNNADTRGLQPIGRSEDVLQERLARDFVEHLGQIGFHSCALAGGQHDYVQIIHALIPEPFCIGVTADAASGAGRFVDPLLRDSVLISQRRDGVACGTGSGFGHDPKLVAQLVVTNRFWSDVGLACLV
jgi:hypothetical protein